MRTITLEEHYASPSFLEGPGKGLKEHAKDFTGPRANLLEQLSDVGDRRISDMDAAGIDMQVLSLNSPGVEQLEGDEAMTIARASNDFLADAVKRNPTRFAAFATLPTAIPDKAVEELERTVREYGFKGAMINGHVRGRYLDDKFFWSIFEKAEALGVPIYLHPTQPPKPVLDAYYGGFEPQVSYMFANAGWGWHIETGVHVLRMILGGVFDQYPKLQIVIGHLGEALPFMIQRVDNMPPEMTKLKHPISYYLRENVHYTFSGFNFTPTFIDLLLQVGVDRIMFSADYPYASMAEARAFLDKLPVSPDDREQIAHGNAERLFKL
jgi:predicted TIM-barrel fold metal-dependent hydrolase